MIDLHTHILPGLDDGASTLDESLDLARTLAERGVTTVAGTPHVDHEHGVDVDGAAAAGRELAAAIEVAGIEIGLIVAGEVDLVRALDTPDEELGRLCLDGRGSTLLVETPYGPLTAAFEPMLEELTGRGFRVLLAHPERNASVQDDPDRVARWVERGVLVQLTAGAVVAGPRSRRRSARSAWELMRRRLAHAVASDVHRPGGDRPLLPDAREALSGPLDELGEHLCHTSPAAIAGGRAPEAPPPLAAPRRRWGRRA
ncbi:MAG: CpsB/CapC family capsule biosynthesis tyrosine phosphatase [Miltoncostaeaceae bacterium]